MRKRASPSPFFDWALVFLWMMATTLGWVLSHTLLLNLDIVLSGLAIGILQAFVLKGRLRAFWGWIIATTLGWFLGVTLGLALVPDEMSFLTGFLTGALLGVAQWLVLRREVNLSGWWIAISIVGWSTGLVYLPGLLLTGAISGLLTGIALELLLRNPKPVQTRLEPE
jgi:hypothetical protein